MNRNNNPLNIKQDPRDPWKGSHGTDARGHAVFDSPMYGVRAAMMSLDAKWRNGKRSLYRICADWAPVDDTIGSIAGNPPNDPSEYACFCADYLGDVAPDESLRNPREEPAQWCRVMRAMARYDMGEDCPWDVIFDGVALWANEMSL
jgi:hypothetical protein